MVLGEYDVAVIGGGHAGCEAALAAARLGMKTVMFSISLDAIGNLPCNPSIGGTAKGHLVRELDALGGEMGKAADASFIQSKMLNKGKGPAVHSLRAQIDRKKYHVEMKKRVENQENLQVKQAEIVNVITDEDNNVTEVVTHTGVEYKVKAVIIASGTYLKGKILIGSYSRESGPDGMFPANELSENLRRLGIELKRFKTGTPARVHADTLDYSKMELEEGDEKIVPFSFETENVGKNLVPCYLVYTNEKTHQIIHDNLGRSAMYGGMVEGIGPRYCPSIEDKVVRFAEKPRHQLFMEPMGLDTKEVYAQGFSTSMPEDVQLEMYRSVEGLENVEIMRPAYAIEYDCLNPTQLTPALQVKHIEGLYSAGQANGTSGYEEAAAQGLMAGINSALWIEGKEPFILARSEAYIGVLIDDLVTKGTNEPYRMMTSRSEYRLLLRQDNADMRLTEKGREIGLVKDDRWAKFTAKKANIEEAMELLRNTPVNPSKETQALLESLGTAPIRTGIHAYDLVKRNELSYAVVAEAFALKRYTPDVEEAVDISITYEGYIKKQMDQVDKVRKLEEKILPKEWDYTQIKGISLEAQQKLNKIRPHSIGQASRISGVSPADVSVLLIQLEQYNRSK